MKFGKAGLVLAVICISLANTSIWAVDGASNSAGALKESGSVFARIAKSASPAVVSVSMEKQVDVGQGGEVFGGGEDFGDLLEKFFGPQGPQGPRFNVPQQPRQQQKRRVRGQGSGFVITTNGYILTNNHMVSGVDSVTVKFTDGREMKAKVIGTDAPTDLAVIKVDANDLPVLELGDSDKLQVGEWVVAIGNPFGLTSTVTAGIVSAKGRSGFNITAYEDFIQTDAAINPGNSGGPLLNIDGKVVGINTAILSQSGGNMGIGLAIPISMAKNVYKQLIEKGSVTRGYMGIVPQQITSDFAKKLGLATDKGILVGDVSPDSPAEKAGLKRGDVITEMNDEVTDDVTAFRNHVAMLEPESKATLIVVSEGKEKTITITIGKLPTQTEDQGKGGEEDNSNKIGIKVQNLTEDLASRFGYKETKGVIVISVEEDSPAADEGLVPGSLILEVDRVPVANTDEFAKALRKSKDSVLLLVKQGEYTRYVLIKL